MPLEWKVLTKCATHSFEAFVPNNGSYHFQDADTFDMHNLEFKTLAQYSYLEPGTINYIYMYHHVSGGKTMFGICVPVQKKGSVVVVDKANQMSNLTATYNAEHSAK
jgi:DNA polymerase epsilon subunit 1